MIGNEHSRPHDRSALNQSGINISVDKTVAYPFFHTCIKFKIVQDISGQKIVFMCLADGSKKETPVYCGLCTIMSHRETDRHPSRHAYCTVVK